MRLDAVADFRVLVVGDAIYDRYRFCEPLGRATKEAVISVRFQKEEEYRGGVWASAAHIIDLCQTVDVWHGELATVNTKYIGRYAQKLFSVHEVRKLENGFIPPEIRSYDVVIAFDYGYGFLTRELRERIMAESRFLAVNAQTNSSNYGFNRVNEKWPSADLCVIDEIEARLAAHEAEAPIEDVILKLPYPRTIVTMGSAGAIGYGNREFYRDKAITDRPVDLLGAGDAVLAVVAPFAKAGCSIKELVHLGNIAGAIKVGIMGHQAHITKALLEENLK
jgi:bifunctional ADP-heptose synthase (sugar kinase/adenylyltransferase)